MGFLLTERNGLGEPGQVVHLLGLLVGRRHFSPRKSTSIFQLLFLFLLRPVSNEGLDYLKVSPHRLRRCEKKKAPN